MKVNIKLEKSLYRFYQLCNCLLSFQGKGEMQTYWLLDSERKEGKGAGNAEEKK